jgi:hypothetical protein
MAIATLATTRYTEVGTYIGQFFLPGAGSLPNEARVVCLVGRGDRTIVIKNNPITRSFVYNEPLTFTAISPHTATLNFPADGTQNLPIALTTRDGVVITANKWAYIQDMYGTYIGIQLVDSAYDPTAQYFFSYQSTSRDVIDPIPTITVAQLAAVSAEVREIQAVGTLQSQQEFTEYKNFVGIYDINPPVGSPSNSNPTTSFSTINITGVSGTGTLILSTSALYSHQYSRLYTVTCTAAPGIAPNRTADFSWTATPVSFGNHALPAVPLNPAADAPTFTMTEGLLNTYTQLLELGVLIDLDFGATNFTVGDTFYFQANGPSLLEIDALNLNTNQYTEFSAITPTLMPLSTGSVVYKSTPSSYVYTNNNLSFVLKVISTTGTSPAPRQAVVVWAGFGSLMPSGSFTLDEFTPSSLTQPLGASGIELTFDFGATHFVEDDQFNFIVNAPRLYYKGKEAVRDTQFTIGNVTYPATNRTAIAGSYLTNTPEGGFGAWQADSSVNQGRFEIPDGLRFYVRNTYLSTLVNPVPSGSMLNTGDQFNMQALFLGGLDFSLLSEETQTISNPSEIATDTAGAITGTVGASYITLNNTPITILSLTEITTSNPVSFAQVPGTPYLIITEPGFGLSSGDLMVNYRWSGLEPAPGQVYYLTALYLRPIEFYNTPFLFLSQTATESFLAPSTVRNDLYIGCEIAWSYNIPGLFVIQVKDSDDDGIFSRADFKVAVNAFAQDKRATDLVVLNFFAALPDQLQVINTANDPFQLHESLTWIGAPIGTNIGSATAIGTLVFLSNNTLAVYGQSPAHGTRILVGSTRATMTIILADSNSTTVTLDGSFVAAALAALNSSFADPKETILLKQITNFDTMQTYTPAENLMLGGNNIVFLEDQGSGVYVIKEDITTDPFSSDTLNINQMVQKQFVTRDIRTTINRSLISMVFTSANAGVVTLQSILVSRLGTLVGNNLIGLYQDDTGKVRDLSPSIDVLVFRDTADPTLFHIGYNYFLATVAKRVYGLYTVNLASGFPK